MGGTSQGYHAGHRHSISHTSYLPPGVSQHIEDLQSNNTVSNVSQKNSNNPAKEMDYGGFYPEVNSSTNYDQNANNTPQGLARRGSVSQNQVQQNIPFIGAARPANMGHPRV